MHLKPYLFHCVTRSSVVCPNLTLSEWLDTIYAEKSLPVGNKTHCLTLEWPNQPWQ